MANNFFKACFRPSAWVLQPSASTFAPDSNWSNRDMDPVPPKGRTWSTYNYVAYWISDAINPVSWELASSMLAVGLSWYENFSSYMPAMLTIVKEASSSSNCSWSHYHRLSDGLERHSWSTTSCWVSCVEPFVLRFLVQLFQHYQSSRLGHVLVWHPNVYRVRMRLSGGPCIY